MVKYSPEMMWTTLQGRFIACGSCARGAKAIQDEDVDKPAKRVILRLSARLVLVELNLAQCQASEAIGASDGKQSGGVG